jgi:hypothetical protein
MQPQDLVRESRHALAPVELGPLDAVVPMARWREVRRRRHADQVSSGVAMAAARRTAPTTLASTTTTLASAPTTAPSTLATAPTAASAPTATVELRHSSVGALLQTGVDAATTHPTLSASPTPILDFATCNK